MIEFKESEDMNNVSMTITTGNRYKKIVIHRRTTNKEWVATKVMKIKPDGDVIINNIDYEAKPTGE